jgi:hypothetical protein
MQQRVPEFGLVEHEGPMVCDICHEEVTFLVGVSQTETDIGKNHCKECFSTARPEFTDSIADFAELLDTFLEMKAQQMTIEEMYELYGEGAEPPTEEEETDEDEPERAVSEDPENS